MLRLAFCIAGIYACFLTWGVVQERVSTTPYGPSSKPQKFKQFIFLNVIQSLIASLVAFVYLKFTGKRAGIFTTPPRILLQYAQVALFNCIGSPFGYASLRHIDYPTMILGKSCKLVPVMFMNVVLYRRRFPVYKYVCVFLVTAGVSVFMLWHPTEKKKGAAVSSLLGLFLLTMNLAIDGVTNATQDQMFHAHRALGIVTGQHMMFWMNLLGSAFMAGYLAVEPWTGELRTALEFCATYPAVWRDIALFGLCGALGQCFIFYTLEHYGGLVLVTVTVTRKLFTMLLSVFWFNHVLTLAQWGGVVLVFSGIGLEAYIKRMERPQKIEQSILAPARKPISSTTNGHAGSNSRATNGRKKRSRRKGKRMGNVMRVQKTVA